MEKSLGPLRDSQLMKPTGPILGLEQFPDAAITIPRLIIGQPNNLSGWTMGKFNNNLTNEYYDELTVVLLKMQRSRTLWPPGKPKLGDLPICRSSNAKTADQEFYGNMCARCDSGNAHQECVDENEKSICSHAKFTHDGRPECRLAYHLLLASIDTADVFILSVTGKGISPTNRLISNFKVKGRTPFSAQFKISLIKATDGEYFTIKYSDFHWFESPDELKALFDKYQARPITPAREEEVPVNEH